MGIRVKPLEWHEKTPGRYIAKAPFNLGQYVVDRHPGGELIVWIAPGPDEDWQPAKSLEDAFAAAQADFEARILAALEPTPTPDAREKADAAWKPIESAPRDGRWVWLWNKNCEDKTLAPQAYRWSTHYSVFGLGGCWTDGLATMGDKIDFDFWCELLPANFVDPYADETRTTGGGDD